jgi:long-chain acyl-CoA synthetase
MKLLTLRYTVGGQRALVMAQTAHAQLVYGRDGQAEGVNTMATDIDLYRRIIKLPATMQGRRPVMLNVIDAGPRDALRTIVCIHGFGGRATHWRYQVEYFSDENRVIALDLRGHGLSDAPHSRYTIDELAGDVAQALDILGVKGKFILLAHSFGVAVAVYFMRAHPGRVERLVLIASPVRFKLRWTSRLALRMPEPLIRAARRLIPPLRIYPRSHVITTWNRNSLTRWDGTQYFKEIDVPTLVILGQRDILFRSESYRQVAQLIPGAREITIPVSKHQVMVERPDAVNRAIERFIGPPPLSEERQLRRREQQALERARPWLKFYDSRTPYRIDPPVAPIQRGLEIAARLHPTAPALSFYERRMTYHALDRYADRFASGLEHIGLAPGERVLVLLPNVPQVAIAYYGILKAGGVVVFAAPDAQREDLVARIRDSGAVMAICLSLHYPRMKEIAEETGMRSVIVTSYKEYLRLRDRILFTLLRQRRGGHTMPATVGVQHDPLYTFNGVLRRGGLHAPEVTIGVDDLAVIQYINGPGEEPVGAMLTHANLAANAQQVRYWLPESRPADERLLAVVPFSHAYGLTIGLNLAPLVGAMLILLPRFDVRETLETVAREQPTIFPGAPPMYSRLANYPGVRRYGISSIRTCISGGAPLPIEVQEAFERLTRGRLVEGYGLTEASPVTHITPISGRRKARSIGIPLSDTEAKIIDPSTGADLPPGDPGELVIRGPQVMRGYWNRPEQTEHVLAGGWLHTGDIARMDDDGYFFIIDRIQDVQRIDGQIVYPREIEEVLYEHPAVLDAAAVGVPDAEGRTHVLAFVVLRPEESATPAELLEYCRQRLAHYEVPESITFLPSLPRTPEGKVLREELAARAQ